MSRHLIGVITLLLAAVTLETLDLHQLWVEQDGALALTDTQFWAMLLVRRVLNGVVVLALATIGAVLLFRMPDDDDAARLLTLCLSFGALGLAAGAFTGTSASYGSDGSLIYGYFGPPVISDLYDRGLESVGVVMLILALGAMLRFATLYPAPLTTEGFVKWEEGQRRGRGPVIRAVDAMALRPTAVWGATGVTAALVVGGTAGPDSVWAVLVAFGLMLWGVALVVRYLRVSSYVSSPENRQKMFWVLQGVVASVTLLLLSIAVIVTPGVPSIAWNVAFPLTTLSPLVFFFFLAFGVFYKGAMDPRLVVTKTTLLGTLGVIAVFGFAALESLLSELLEARFGLPGMLGASVSGGLVALALLPLRKRLGPAVDRLIPSGNEQP